MDELDNLWLETLVVEAFWLDRELVGATTEKVVEGACEEELEVVPA